MNHPKTIIHLLSGGLDSVVMLYDLHSHGELVHALLFDYRQRHIQELEWARLHCRRLGVNYTKLDIPMLPGSELTDGKGGVVVPNRNAIFLSLAVNLAAAMNAETVTFACNKDDEEVFPDCRREFIDAMNATVKAAGYSIEICAPYLDRSKAGIARQGAYLGVKLDETWSCYRGGLKPCGKCPACLKREAAIV